MTRRQIFDLMRNAYGIRSSLVATIQSRGTSRSKDESAPLDEVIAPAEDVVRQALLHDAMTGGWSSIGG
jgi:hypothetical protein